MAIVGYEFQKRLNGTTEWDAVVDLGPQLDLTEIVAELPPSTTFNFQVRGYDVEGNRTEWSNIATASTLGLDLGDPIQWLRADILELDDEDEITAWADSSAFDNDGSAIPGQGPFFDTEQVNDLPAARFEGTEELLLTITNSTPGSAAEMMLVLRAATDPAGTAVTSGSWRFTPNATTQRAHYPTTGGQIEESFATSVRKSVGNPSQDLSQWHIYSVYSAAADYKAFINGAEIFSTGTNSFTFTTDAGLGRSNEVPAPIDSLPQFVGWIAEYILWDRKLTDEERETAVAYLAEKYDITLP